ncbi:MAG: DNA mismatch repair protein MutS [Flavobacteriales bacterium]|nr:DNA mismatch repair protein MutS [Flavobacteriales bacterium]
MIDQHSIDDLELEKVKQAIYSYCRSDKGRALCMRIRPYKNYGALGTELRQTDEYLRGGGSDVFPSSEFTSADDDIKMLAVEGATLSTEAFLRLADISEKTNAIIQYLNRYAEFYPYLLQKLKNVEYTTAITEPVWKIMEHDGVIKDTASPLLEQIRRTMASIRGNIDRIFNAEMARYRSEGLLDDIGESVADHRRVLAVSAMHRKKVAGSFCGTSKTGSIVFIEPESTARLTREMADAQVQEKEEIQRILHELTALLRPHATLLAGSQKLLTEIDLIQAKVRYAQSIDACLPKMSKSLKMNLKEAYHPILFLQNKADGRQTFPQNIVLTPQRRIIAISGPNAGGKSITLKTVGLLQLMLQCGILVPVNPESTMCLFENIITDIGDNQSIENHLSTYSYRLKNMAGFLKICNNRTLFLIDEFGTGSDPDLGGALAAVFLEEFYNKGAYGVLTTHYTNIKLLVEDMAEAVNASMLFDQNTLRPLYRLFVGQAGSSFTFEVAQMNGISKELISRAKERVEHDKIVLDRTIASLQKEKSNIVEQSKNLTTAQKKASYHAEALEKTNEKISSKLESYQQLYDRNVKQIQVGRKMEALADAYFFKKTNKKDLITQVMKMIEIENAKKAEKVNARIKEKEKTKALEDEKQRKRAEEKERRAMAEQLRHQREEEEKLEAQIQKEIEPIREEKAAEGVQEVEKTKLNVPLGVADRVRLEGGYSVGVIDKIEKGIATVDYGWFTTRVNVDELDLVEKAKRKK